MLEIIKISADDFFFAMGFNHLQREALFQECEILKIREGCDLVKLLQVSSETWNFYEGCGDDFIKKLNEFKEIFGGLNAQ